MKVSIVLPTHSNYYDCVEAINSILHQKYGNIELLIIIDNNKQLYKKLTRRFQNVTSKIRFILTPKPTSLSESRNIGAKEATGDIVVFTDDDIIADENWIKNIVKTYKKYDAVGVSGQVIPLWKGNTKYLPNVLLWLVGCTYEGFCDKDVCKIRNGIGPNFSFQKRVFEKVGYFNENLGFADRGRKMLQGEEAEFSLRVIKAFGNKIIHTKDAIVYHKVPEKKTKLLYLLKRSFWQGYSKAVLEISTEKASIKTEQAYLETVLKHVSNNIISIETLIIMLVVLAVGFGYLYGRITLQKKQERDNDENFRYLPLRNIPP